MEHDKQRRPIDYDCHVIRSRDASTGARDCGAQHARERYFCQYSVATGANGLRYQNELLQDSAFRMSHDRAKEKPSK